MLSIGFFFRLDESMSWSGLGYRFLRIRVEANPLGLVSFIINMADKAA